MGEDTTKEKAVHALPRTEMKTVPRTDAAVEALFEAHHDRVYRVARRITGSSEDAEDVLQTVFYRLVRRDEPVPVPGEAASYFHRAASNAAFDLLRRRRAARTAPIPDADLLSDTTPGPDALQRSSEFVAAVRRALADVSPRAAEMFALRYFDGYGNREIARLTNTSWSTVAVTLHRTRAKLQKSLKGELR